MTAISVNPASPWVVDTRLLERRPGTMRTLRTTLATEEPMGIEILAVPAGEPVELDVRLESVVEGVLVSGRASTRAVGECARCLTAIEVPVEAELRELYAYPNSLTAQTIDEDELPVIADERIDLEQLVRDEIVTAMPLAPVCRPDCQGLCVDCGGRLDDLEPGHTHEILDPRWAALLTKTSGSATAASGQRSRNTEVEE